MPSPRANNNVEKVRPRSTPATPLRSSRSGPLNTGVLAGTYNNGNIRDRIFKWQNHSADAIAPEEAGARSDIDDGSVQDAAGNAATTERRVPRTRAQTATFKSKPLSPSKSPARMVHIGGDAHTPETPKKRLVSDEHWMKERENPHAPSHGHGFPPKVDLPKPTTEYDIWKRPGDTKFEGWVRKKKLPETVDRVEVTPNGVVKWQERISPERMNEMSKSSDTSLLKQPKSYEEPRSRVKPAQMEFVKPMAKESPKPAPKEPQSPPKRSAPRPIPSKNIQERKHALQYFAGMSPPKPVTGMAEKAVKEPRNPFATLEYIIGKPVGAALANGQSPENSKKVAGDLSKTNPADDGSNPNLHSSNPRIEAWLGGTPEKFEKPNKLLRPEHHNVGLNDEESGKRPLRPRREQLEELRRERRKQRRKEVQSEPRLDSSALIKESTIDDYFSRSHDAYTTRSEESPTKSIDDSPSTPGLKRRGAKRDRQSPRKKESPDHIPPPPHSVWSEDVSIYPDDSASAVIPPAQPKQTVVPQSKKSRRPSNHDREKAEISNTQQSRPEKKPENSLAMQLARPNLKRNVTTEEDLMTVLSMPDGHGVPLKSACSLKSRRSKREPCNDDELLASLRTEEAKYARELRTLIDGVIPVLLTTVMSKDKRNVASGLFGNRGGSAKATTPIVNMGIALERLRSIHRRMPITKLDALVVWADQAEKVYSDYIKAWRMGFQDVVVNLAPGESASKSSDSGMKKDDEGFVVGEHGERVDVAYLLKRPLVRVKNLSKTLKGIAQNTATKEAKSSAEKYHNLVEQAKQRQNEERGRLEDEAAASIDSTRARDPRSLAPLPGVSIDPSRCVRARDTFDLHFPHSSGQKLDCRVELILRDNHPSCGNGGDVLICELDATAKWLLMPPIQTNRISARMNTDDGCLIVMVRDSNPAEDNWYEVFSLRGDDDESGSEWMSMLGTNPVPPSLPSNDQFLLQNVPSPSQPMVPSTSYTGQRKVSPCEIEVPLGEQASVVSRRSVHGPTSGVETTFETEPQVDNVKSQRPKSVPSAVSSSPAQARPLPTPPAKQHRKHGSDPNAKIAADEFPQSLNDALDKAGSELSLPNRPMRSDYNAVNALRNSGRPRKHDRVQSSHQEWHLPRHSRARPPSPPVSTTSSGRPFSVWMPSSEPGLDDGRDDPFVDDIPSMKSPLQRRDASMPTYKSSIPDFGKNRRERSRAESNHHHASSNIKQASWEPLMSGGRDGGSSLPGSTTDRHVQQPAATSKSVPTTPGLSPADVSRELPIPPASEPVQIRGPRTPHLSPPSSQRSQKNTPSSSSPKPIPNIDSGSPGFARHRRSSSPLKHEYAPSAASEESLVANILEDSDDSDNESLTSHSSTENDVVPSLPNFSTLHNRRSKTPATLFEPKNSAPVAPGSSASQMGHRGAPAGDIEGKNQIASIFAWSDTKGWAQLTPDECAVVVSPGLIEAFDMTSFHSALSSKTNPKQPPTSFNPSSPQNPNRPASISPLVALELTPLVPLRRGTAIDISVRSPPTPASALRKKIPTSQLMFRSRTNVECDNLYAAINHARIHNPTYIALQNARPDAHRKSNWAAIMDNRESEAGGRSWWKIGRKSGTHGRSSYRAGSSRRTPSVAAHTDGDESSAAESLGGALSSALKRLSAPGGKVFNVAKSTITGPDSTSPFNSSRGSATFSSSSGGANPSGSSTPPAGTGTGVNPTPAELNAGIDPSAGTPLGIRNLKIRLYERVAMGNSWRDRGSARLTILQPPRPPGAPPPLAPDGRLIQKKRVVVLGKTKGEVLLDVTLGEEAFERVGRVGIAIRVGEELEDVKDKGGVAGTRVRVWMCQCRKEGEAGFMFGLVGRGMRY